MGRPLNKLSDTSARAARKPGRYSDGGGLYLNVASGGSKSWVFMWKPKGSGRREMGLGAYPDIPLAKARAKATECRALVADGKDPIAERDRGAAPTFTAAAEGYVATHAASFRNAKHLEQWRMTLSIQRDAATGELLETGYCRALRDRRVNEIETEHILEALRPIWIEIPETASRVRGRIERILDAERAAGRRRGENPARWRGHLDKLLPKRPKISRGHHSAMHYDDVPAFFQKLGSEEGTAAKALRFTILTCARTGETIGATWQEIDFERQVWTIPAGRMKGAKEHVVPLSKDALALLNDLKAGSQSDHVFASRDGKSPLSSMAMLMLLRRMNVGAVTAHGFRSTFRDWAGDKTKFDRETAEGSLAHVIGSETEQAYRRATALQKRRRLLQAWADYLSAAKGRTDNDVPMRAEKVV